MIGCPQHVEPFLARKLKARSFQGPVQAFHFIVSTPASCTHHHSRLVECFGLRDISKSRRALDSIIDSPWKLEDEVLKVVRVAVWCCADNRAVALTNRPISRYVSCATLGVAALIAYRPSGQAKGDVSPERMSIFHLYLGVSQCAWCLNRASYRR